MWDRSQNNEGKKAKIMEKKKSKVKFWDKKEKFGFEKIKFVPRGSNFEIKSLKCQNSKFNKSKFWDKKSNLRQKIRIEDISQHFFRKCQSNEINQISDDKWEVEIKCQSCELKSQILVLKIKALDKKGKF